MGVFKRTGFDYIPAAGETYYPEGAPASDSDGSTVVAEGTDSNLVRDKKGNLIVTDKNNNRRSRG